MKSFESNIEEGLDLDRYYEKALKILRRDEIKISDFADLYGEEITKKDEHYVAIREADFARDNNPENISKNKLAVVFEAIIFEQGEQSEWFGENAYTIKTSRYDDIKNGVDMVLEFQEEYSAYHMALAVDVTYGKETEKKIAKILGEIGKGELANIKYFVSDHLNFRGELANIPRVIIGADATTVKNLSELWMSKDMKGLAENSIQLQILEETFYQCQSFGSYAKSLGKTEIADYYKRAEKFTAEILAEKKNKIKDSDKRDSIFYALQSKMNSLGEK